MSRIRVLRLNLGLCHLLRRVSVLFTSGVTGGIAHLLLGNMKRIKKKNQNQKEQYKDIGGYRQLLPVTPQGLSCNIN